MGPRLPGSHAPCDSYWANRPGASAAAIDHVGEGKIAGTEVRDEESYYEVEVTLESGEQVDVQFNERFQVVGTDEDRLED